MRKTLLIGLLLSVGFSQQNWNIEFMKVHGRLTYSPNSDKPYTGKVHSFRRGHKELEATYKDGIEIERSEWEYEDGNIRSEKTYKDGVSVGKWTYWYYKGQKKKELTWKDGKVISSKHWNQDGSRR